LKKSTIMFSLSLNYIFQQKNAITGCFFEMSAQRTLIIVYFRE
jgi:hypothetical protein